MENKFFCYKLSRLMENSGKNIQILALTSTVIATIFKPLERLDQNGRDLVVPKNANDATHENMPL